MPDDLEQEVEFGVSEITWGATLREQFAMAALTGLLAAQNGMRTKLDTAEEAYRIADIMMEARDE